MPEVRNRTVIAIGASVENVLADSLFEIMPGLISGVPVAGWELQFGIVSNVDSVFADVVSGSDVLAENSEISDANRWPLAPDDFTLTDQAGPGERIKIRLRNENAAAATVRTIMILTPIFA